MNRRLAAAALAVTSIVFSSCGGGGGEPAPSGPVETTPAGPTWEAPKGCPPVPVPDGDFDLLGDPRACKGGQITLETNSYPTHMNYYGPDRDYGLQQDYTEAMFNTLVTLHPSTSQVIPELATSWEEPVPGKELVFHLDPDAKWSDGKPITAQDVVATYDLAMSKPVAEVLLRVDLENLGRPIALDERTVKFVAKTASWRNLIFLSDIYILPAHAIDPKTYIEAWKWKPPVVSGPYDLGASKDGEFFTFVRRKDFWGEGKRQFIGIDNFDVVYRKVIDDGDKAYEFFKKGDIDFYLVTKAQMWHEETEIDKVEKGWIQKQRMYQREPEAFKEWAFNLTDPLFQDVRVRRALFWLLDRESLHDQLFFHEYVNMSSYFANSIYENPANEKITFSPEKGVALLAEAGWTEKDAEGVLVKDGRRFEFDLIYPHSTSDRIYTPIQETWRKYGIKVNLKLIQPSAWVKVTESKDFQMVYINWGRVPFPNIRVYWHSSLADEKDSNNITHYKNPRVDALIDQYDAEFDLAKRALIVQEIDGILYADTPYLLDWYAETWRNLWWDKFGYPEWVTWSNIDIRHTLWQTWWAEPERAKRMEDAMAAGTATPRAPAENTSWKRK